MNGCLPKGYCLTAMEENEMDYVTQCIKESILESVEGQEKELSDYWINQILFITVNNITNHVMSDEIFILKNTNDEKCGMLWMGVSNDQFTCDVTGYLLGIYVNAEMRGDGLGSSLLSAAEKWCTDKGYLALTLNVGYPNKIARSLYESKGYSVQTEVRKKSLANRF